MADFFEVAVNAPISELLTYLPPVDKLDDIIGKKVIVPLGKRKVDAVVLKETHHCGDFKLKSIIEVKENPNIPVPYLKWLTWISNYYCHPIGQVTQLCFPPLERAKNKRQVVKKQAPLIPETKKVDFLKLTNEQESCLKNIKKHFDSFHVHLLKGVTGSGKTEVYLQLLDEVLKKGKRGLVLVPEISLTPQLLQRFSSRFPGQIAVIHSHLTNREKTNQWLDVIDNKKQILIGARSALFCPIDDMGLIIIDEEHEPSFKQDEKLKYHARDAAIMLAKELNCPILLGSATPSLESWKNALDERYHLHEMKHRVSNRKLPNIFIVDMRNERKTRKENKDKNAISNLPFWLSEKLYHFLKETYDNKKQSALFLNRRGVAQSAICQACGYIHECPNCAISLTLHGKNHLVCHYCNYSEVLKEQCSICSSEDVITLGLGTELIEHDIKKLFPDAKLDRADRDVIDSRVAMEDLIKNMEDGHTDILIGTQMIAKGLDFPLLQTVGLVMADVGFNIPDFRTSERNFQLLTQVSGRAGRHSEYPGNVIIQTYNPEHVSIIYTKQNDFEKFAQSEFEARKDFAYPPFGKIAAFRIQGNVNDNAQKAAHLLARRAQLLKDSNDQYQPIFVLGPTPAAIAKLRGKFRYQLLLKTSQPSKLLPFCQQLVSDMKWLPPGTKVQIDIDPINMM